jgi:hypothetical protein
MAMSKIQFYSLAEGLLSMLNHPVEALHPVFYRHSQVDLSGLMRPVHLWQKSVHLASCIMSRHSYLGHSKEEEVTRRQIWTVSWGGDSRGFCCSKGCLTSCCCVVVHCPDGRECLEMFSANSPDRRVLPNPEQPIRQRRLYYISYLSEHTTDF